MTYVKGDFVDCAFPFRERPDAPETRRLHIAYVERTVALPNGTRAVVLYTTSSGRSSGRLKRRGEIDVDERSSRAMGMRQAFTIDVFRVLVVPINKIWFPNLNRPESGIRGRAPERLQRHIGQIFERAVAEQEPLLDIYPRPPDR